MSDTLCRHCHMPILEHGPSCKRNIKIRKESTTYVFVFDDPGFAKFDKVSDAVYELDGVEDVDAYSDGLGVIIDGKHDTPEMLDKIRSIINTIGV